MSQNIENDFDSLSATPYDCAPMLKTIPENPLARHVDPWKFAQQGVTVKGQIAVHTLPRLCELLSNNSGIVDADLVFSIDEQRTRSLSGEASVTLYMNCQRCLKACHQDIKVTFGLALIWSDDKAANVPKDLDPWVVGETSADLHEVVEDELLLSLPIVAYHNYECVPQSLFRTEPETAIDEPSKLRDNPFQVLEKLKTSSDAELTDGKPTDKNSSDL